MMCTIFGYNHPQDQHQRQRQDQDILHQYDEVLRRKFKLCQEFLCPPPPYGGYREAHCQRQEFLFQIEKILLDQCQTFLLLHLDYEEANDSDCSSIGSYDYEEANDSDCNSIESYDSEDSSVFRKRKANKLNKFAEYHNENTKRLMKEWESAEKEECNVSIVA